LCKSYSGNVNFNHARLIGRLQSSLTDTQTQAVLEILAITKLDSILEQIPLGEVRLIESWFDFDDLNTNLASGICIPPSEDFRRRYGYPHLRVRAITRADHIPPGDEALRPGISEAVCLVATPTEWMQSVLIHEIGHHLIFEQATQLAPIIELAFSQMQHPISQLASFHWEEYFCENLTAYFLYPKELQEHDQIGYNLIVQALELLRGNV
jgi:hypothetical protein